MTYYIGLDVSVESTAICVIDVTGRVEKEISGEWAKLGGQAARFETVSLSSRTAARVTATRCAPCGDHLMRRRLPMRVLPMSSTQPSARDD